MELATKIIRDNELLNNEIDGEVVLMSLAQGKYFGIDEVGTRIWNIIEKPITIDELLKILIAEYDIDYEKCREEVLEFLNQLLDQKIIKYVD